MPIAMIGVVGRQFSIVLANDLDAMTAGDSRVVTFELHRLTDEEKDAVRLAVQVALMAIDQHVLRNLNPQSANPPVLN